MKRIVIKLGTGILTHGIGEIDTQRIFAYCNQIARLKEEGHEVLVVSSGAVGMGMGALGLKRRPSSTDKKQACAAIGQSLLTQTWQNGFNPYGITVGQVLLTHDVLHQRKRYVSAKNTIERIINYGAVPIINENDTVSAREIQFGNNDILGAMVSSLSEADEYIILTTVDGLLDMANGKKLISSVPRITKKIEALAQDTTSATAVGGMITKLEAAKLATRSGCDTFIAHGSEHDIIYRLVAGEAIGTRFAKFKSTVSSKKRWLAYFHEPAFSVTVDAGAARAIRLRPTSLLLAGIRCVDGSFERGSVIDILDPKGKAIARAESRLSSDEIKHALTVAPDQRVAQFLNRGNPIVAHRNSLVLL